MFFVYIFITRERKSSLKIIRIQQNTVITFRWLFLSEKISPGAFASRRTGSYVLSSDAQKTAAANIVDPRLVTASKKRTSDPNQSSRLCVRNDIVIGVSVYSWITHPESFSPRAPCYTRYTTRTVSFSLSFFRSFFRILSLSLFWQWLRSFVDTEIASSLAHTRARACLTAL